MRIGFVVNPIAGMGGRVGLKGTDGVIEQARELGAEPRAPDRAREALNSLSTRRAELELFTYGDPMGSSEAEDAGFEPAIVENPTDAARTTAADTRAAVQEFLDRDVDLVLFVGGDGTAVDVADAIEDATSDVPVLGVPAGVKVYSSVFALSPEAAGRIAATFDRTEPREVVDLDEAAYRAGTVSTELHALLPVPMAPDLQATKQLGGGSVEGLAAGVAESVDPDVTYVFGPGSTVGAIEAELGIDGTPLGVDVWRDGELLVKDGSESAIMNALGPRNKVVVSPIGGQGFVFGRGNDQLSPVILGRDDVESLIVASRQKLDDLGVLRVDTGDETVDESIRGWHRVRVGRAEQRLIEVV